MTTALQITQEVMQAVRLRADIYRVCLSVLNATRIKHGLSKTKHIVFV